MDHPKFVQIACCYPPNETEGQIQLFGLDERGEVWQYETAFLGSHWYKVKEGEG